MLTKGCWLAVLAGALVLISLGSIAAGAVSLHLDDVIRALSGSQSDAVARTIVWELRLPRIILAACAGGGLAAAGVAYQGLFRNPLAEPFIIGVASGAALGATVVIVSDWQGPAAEFISPVPLGAFIGALLAVTLTYGLSAVVNADSMAGLLLTGVAVGTLLNAALWVLMTWDDQNLARIVAWLMGSFSGRGWMDLRHVWPLLAVGVVGIWMLARPLDALAEGEETARGLGLHLRTTIGLVVVFASLATAAAVAAGGIIGFIGLIAPHIARRIVGVTHAWLVPASAFLGGALLVLADTVARTITAPVELPVGVVTAAVGGPFFLFMLRGRGPWHS